MDSRIGPRQAGRRPCRSCEFRPAAPAFSPMRPAWQVVPEDFWTRREKMCENTLNSRKVVCVFFCEATQVDNLACAQDCVWRAVLCNHHPVALRVFRLRAAGPAQPRSLPVAHRPCQTGGDDSGLRKGDLLHLPLLPRRTGCASLRPGRWRLLPMRAIIGEGYSRCGVNAG